MFHFFCVAIDAEASSIEHTPIGSAIQGVDVTVSAFSDRDAVVRGRLFFRQIGEREYIPRPMVRSGSAFGGTIPADHVVGTGIEYYIVLYLTDGTAITSPEQNAMLLPHVIVIMPAEQRWFEVLYPERDSLVEDTRPQISVALSADSTITRDNIRVKLDGLDITDDCEITQDFILYIPSEVLSPGPHIVTVSILNDLEMTDSWQFSISGEPPLWGRLSGGASVAWQRAHADSDSPLLMHSPGSNIGLSAQIAGQIMGQSFDAWVNRTPFYRSQSTDFGFGLYSDMARVTAGDVFPSISKLTLDGMPVRGGEANIELFDRASMYIVGGEGRLFTDTEDEFTAGLLNSRFGGLQIAARPFGKKWEIRTLYIHARNHAKPESDLTFSIEKWNDIFSLGMEMNMPAGFTLHSEWARSDHVTRYGEDFASESYKDEGISVGLSRRVRNLALELFYLNVGDRFLSEVNPFVESGRKGFGLSSRYSHSIGLSMQGEYGRYYKESRLNTEARANVNLSLSELPSIFTFYYQQRVPYAKYDIRGMSFGSSYELWKLDFSISVSDSNINLWVDNIERRSISASSSVGYEITAGADLRVRYSQFRSYRSGIISRMQNQAGAEVRFGIGESHLLALELKAARLTDKRDPGNDYFEKVLLLKYGYSF